MTATASPRASWDMSRPHPTHRQSVKKSTTPLAYSPRIPPSVGQSIPPPNPYLNISTPSAQHAVGPSSPNYFGFIVDSDNALPNSDEAAQLKRSWAQSPGSIRSTAAASPKVLPAESNADFEAFRRQSESNSFHLSHGNLSNFTLSPNRRVSENSTTSASNREARPRSPGSSNDPSGQESADCMDIDEPSQPDDSLAAGILSPSQGRQESPADFRSPSSTVQQRNQLAHIDDRHPRLSLPSNRLDPPSPGHFLHSQSQRAATLPVELDPASPSLISAGALRELLKMSPQDVLLLDLRPASKFSQGRIADAINICLSTMLLKRTSFTADRLAEGFSNQQHREKFNAWRSTPYIVAYDDRSPSIQEAASLVTLLKKFPHDARKGRALILQGMYDLCPFQRQWTPVSRQWTNDQ
jgi:rhodanese-related sulfurtransferase